MDVCIHTSLSSKCVVVGVVGCSAQHTLYYATKRTSLHVRAADLLSTEATFNGLVSGMLCTNSISGYAVHLNSSCRSCGVLVAWHFVDVEEGGSIQNKVVCSVACGGPPRRPPQPVGGFAGFFYHLRSKNAIGHVVTRIPRNRAAVCRW